MATTRLPPFITPGILNHPGITPESKRTAEHLLEKDRDEHHCFYGPGFHNHLSHHILAAFDLGAPPKVLQAIYDSHAKDLVPINKDRKTGETIEERIITEEDWTQHLGDETYYGSYLKFFTTDIAANGPEETMEKRVFAPSANGNGSKMLIRFIGGAFHPLIQTGYGAEFGSNAMIAQGLAMAAVHSALDSSMFDPVPSSEYGEGLPLLEILGQVYESKILEPVMPYDPNAFINKRVRDACTNGRAEEIRRLAALWWPAHPILTEAEDLNKRVEDMLWTSALLLAGSGKPGRKPRLDFFLMHVLNSSIFLPSLMKIIPTRESRTTLLKALLPYVLLYVEARGRPRINPELMLSYTAMPWPPLQDSDHRKPDPSALGDPNDPECVNPWPAIIDEVIHAPDEHTTKAIRSLYFADQRYGTTKVGEVPGAFKGAGKEETHKAIGKVDGTAFVRAAGVVLHNLGWVTYGQPAGHWDVSALGWDDAWKNGD